MVRFENVFAAGEGDNGKGTKVVFYSNENIDAELLDLISSADKIMRKHEDSGCINFDEIWLDEYTQVWFEATFNVSGGVYFGVRYFV